MWKESARKKNTFNQRGKGMGQSHITREENGNDTTVKKKMKECNNETIN
jgi:hypothetical protein